jgi:ATP-dependent exoDNAse (exonuclease V) beta subunit
MTTAVQPLRDIDVEQASPDDRQFWSVTTIMKALHNPALEYYAIKQTAIAALDSQATWQAMLDDQGKPETVTWLCGARYRRPKITLGAEQLGTVVHRLCELYAITGVRPDRQAIEDLVRAHAAPTVDIDSELVIVNAMLDQFDGWLQRFTPEYTAAEFAVYSEEYGYAGCLDAIFTIGGVELVIDYKTRREPLTAKGGPQLPYGETALQLAAYRYADVAAVWRARRVEQYKRRYYLLSTGEREVAQSVPKVDGGGCLIITPQSAELYPVRCDEEVHTFFLNCQEVFRWEEDVSKRVVGDALTEEVLR